MRPRENVFCTKLEHQDWPTYLAFKLRVHDEMLRLLPDVAGKDDENTVAKNASDFFFDPRCTAFGLFKNGEMIGYTHIDLYGDDLAVLAGSYILHSERGKRYSDLLYKARHDFIVEQTNHMVVIVVINSENIASQKAAERNGFQCKDVTRADGHTSFIYELKVNRDLKPRTENPPQLEPVIS